MLEAIYVSMYLLQAKFFTVGFKPIFRNAMNTTLLRGLYHKKIMMTCFKSITYQIVVARSEHTYAYVTMNSVF